MEERPRRQVSMKQAETKAEAEYVEFNKHQRIDSDFDKAVRLMEKTHQEEV